MTITNSASSERYKRWAEQNRAHLQEYRKAWAARNRELLLEKKRIYRSQSENRRRNYELMKQWRADHPEEQRLHRQVRHANAQAQKYGLDKIGISDVRGLPDYCVYCNSRENLTVDHIHPMSKGGANKRENLTTACLSCNHKKADKIL